MKDYYQILGISPNATQQEIKLTFRKLAVLYHPDKNHTSEDRFKEINEAYRTLNDPEKRAQYDLSLSYPNTITPYQSSHRDPAYRRRRPHYARMEETKSAQELMAEYLPRFRWVCWASLVVCSLVAIDYLLPFQSSQDDIIEINRMYRTGRGGGMIYDHDELITRSGLHIKLYDDEVFEFKKVLKVIIEETYLFNEVVTVSTPDGIFQIGISSLYGNLIFVPIILFISSILGVGIRNNIEFPFNLSIVSFVLLIIVLFLMFK